jgi:hypothetical protein
VVGLIHTGMKFKSWLENQGLPAFLYHVTTAGSDIDRDGFRTADQHGRGTVLGGSFSDAVSFTSNPRRAENYRAALEFARELFHENLFDNPSRLWMLLRPFNPHYDKLKQLLDFVRRQPEAERADYLLLYLAGVTEGRFPAMFGGGMRRRVTPDAQVNVIRISTAPGGGKPGPQKWTVNPQEEEYRIYDPQNIDHSSMEFVS